MATSSDYIEFVMDSLSLINNIEFRYRKMFGEYCVYSNDKPIMLVCDNTVYVKMLPCIEMYMQDAAVGEPYTGAKPHYILDIESCHDLEKIVRQLEYNTPLPKPKKKK